MRNIIWAFSILLTTFLASYVNAGLITHNGYTLNKETNIVTNGQLEWLQWDVTVEQSVNNSLTTHGINGWRLAGATEVAGLFNDFFSSIETFDAKTTTPLENTHQNVSLIDSEYSFGLANQFIELFGDTLVATGFSFDYGDAFESTAAIFGDDVDGDGKYNGAWVFDESTLQDGSLLEGSARLSSDLFFPNLTYTRRGVALVREPVPVSVPEPGSITLLLIGLLGLAFTQHKTFIK